MKTELILHVEERDMKMKPKALRKAGSIPAVYYGKKHPATSVILKESELLKIWKKAGETAVVTLKSKTGDVEALIHDVDRDPISDAFRHVDFYVFEKGQKMKVKVPLEFTGVSPAVKELGGILVKVVRELEIEAEPKHIPQKLDVDTSTLIDFTSQLLAKHIKLPEGVALMVHSDDVIASVYEPKEEIEEVAPVDLSAIEVEKKGKEAKEGEEGVATPAEAPKGDTKEDSKQSKPKA